MPGKSYLNRAPATTLAATLSKEIAITEIGGDYWQQSRRPLTSLVFVAPLLICYELGVLMLGPGAMRNGADVWLRQLLEWLGFSQYFLLPALTVGLLLGWHHMTHQPWRVSPGVLWAMLAECASLAVVLVIIARLQSSMLSMFVADLNIELIRASIWSSAKGWFGEMVRYIGAGVYEELLFRLMLLPAIAWVFKGCGLSWQKSLLIAAVISSVLFSAAHHIGSEGEAIFSADFGYRFCFRIIAGLFFAALFIYRGFGIAAGTHALYDILVSTIY